jgi:3-keto-L-gulonate-6-phosphate decarboxylase
VQGQVSGRTILPMPVGVEKCVTTARELQENAETAVDLYLKSAIEGVVIKWVTQINGRILHFHFSFDQQLKFIFDVSQTFSWKLRQAHSTTVKIRFQVQVSEITEFIFLHTISFIMNLYML